jgi:predicted nucleic-acid-binding Zn-ribbon protein
MPIDKDRIERSLKDKGATKDCAACGRNDWSVADWPVFVTPVDLDKNAILAPGGEMQGMSFIIIGCNNCGFARFHRLSVVLDLHD